MNQPMSVYGLIMGMLLATYLPRLIPFLILSDRPLPEYWRKFLKFIPFTALGALIFPGSVQAVAGEPVVALLGIVAAGICAWFNGGIILSVVVAVGVVGLGLCF